MRPLVDPAAMSRDLMRFHVEALFTHDADGYLDRVNEPGGAPAPRFFLGKTSSGCVVRFRHDVDDEQKRELEHAAHDDLVLDPYDDRSIRVSRYRKILARSAPVERTWEGPAFCFSNDLPAVQSSVLVTESNATLLEPHLRDWIPDVRLCSPMVAQVVDGEAVALCCSVRRTSSAHEAGVETAVPFRGHGYAARVVAHWAVQVHEMGAVPLYSTSWQNTASLAVARKLNLVLFGTDLHIT